LQRPNGAQVQLAGIVIVRQRPPTARGFFFVTLEDETGLTNLIVAPQVFEENRAVLLGCAALLVTGQLQNQHGAISVKGLRFADLAQGLPPASAHSTHPQAPRASTLLQTPTRDFH
jgi:error-prone DNA polymerase